MNMHYKKTISISITLIIIVALLLLGFTAFSDDNNNTQPYKHARYALLSGEVNAAMFNGNNHHTQKVIIKIDTTTGQTWIMQLSVNSGNNPKVRDAVWAPIKNNGQFTPYQNDSQFDQGF
jgi:hypothetical protein